MLKVIPSKLQSLIDQSQYAGGFRQALESFLPLLGNANSGLFFFPEYTDHGPQHIVDDDAIELQRVRLDVGTTIEIRLDQNSAKELVEDAESSSSDDHTWDWYVLGTPVVERRLFGKTVKQDLIIPTGVGASHPEWRPVFHPDYSEILWSYDQSYPGLGLACNGIRVQKTGAYNWNYSWGPSGKQMPLGMPDVSVLDENAMLPLTLQRDRLETSSFPFSKELANEVTRDFCAYLLLNSPSAPRQVSAWRFYPLQSEAEWHPFPGIGPVVASSDGTMLLHGWHIQRSKMKRVFACSKYEELAEVFPGIGARASAYSLSEIEPKVLLRHLLVESAILENMASQDVRKTKASRAVIGVRLLVTDAASLILDPDDETEASYYLRNLNATRLESDYLFEAGALGSSQKGILALREELSGWSEPSVALEVFFAASRTVVPDSPFTEVWSEIMRRPVIPFDPDKRHKSFRTAYESLRDYLDLWADPPEGTWRRDLLDRSVVAST